MSAVADLLLPERCAACDELLPAPGVFCEPCAATLTAIVIPFCNVCAEPGLHAANMCPRCRKARPPFTKARSGFIHAAAVAKAIHRFKYEDRPDLSRQLGGLLGTTLLREIPADSVVVPIPLHGDRFRDRKYDQAALLAVEVAKVSQRPLRDELLTRVKYTERQVGLTEGSRDANVRGAFVAKPEAKGLSIVLVDDVYTTGSTAREATRALQAQGAKVSVVLTLARMEKLTGQALREG